MHMDMNREIIVFTKGKFTRDIYLISAYPFFRRSCGGRAQQDMRDPTARSLRVTREQRKPQARE